MTNTYIVTVRMVGDKGSETMQRLVSAENERQAKAQCRRFGYDTISIAKL